MSPAWWWAVSLAGLTAASGLVLAVVTLCALRVSESRQRELAAELRRVRREP